jgi:CBS domain-containing protein
VRLETLGFDQVYRYADGKADWAAAGLPVEGEQALVPRLLEIAVREVPTCRMTDDLQAVRQTGVPLCVVIDDDERRIILGQIAEAAMTSNTGSSIEDVMEAGPPTYRPNISLEELWSRLEKHPRVQHVLVSTSDGRLLGVVWRHDLEEVVKGEHQHEHA